MMLMAEDGVDLSSSGGEDLGFGGGLEDNDLSIDLDSLMSMLEDDDQPPPQMVFSDYFTEDAQQAVPTADISYFPGSSDNGHGSHVQITSPIHSCSGSLKDWIPLEPKYETSSGAPSGVSNENTTHNVDVSLSDSSYFLKNQNQFGDSLSQNSTLLLPTQYNLNSDDSHLFDGSGPYFADSFDFQSMLSNGDITTAIGDENSSHLMKTEYRDSASGTSQMDTSEACAVNRNGQYMQEEDVKHSMQLCNNSYPYVGLTEQQKQFYTHPYVQWDQQGNYVFNDAKMDMFGYNGLNEMNDDNTSELFHHYHDDRSSTNVASNQQHPAVLTLPGPAKILAGEEQAVMPISKTDNSLNSAGQTSLRNISGSRILVSETKSSGDHKVTAGTKQAVHMKYQREGKQILLNGSGHHSSKFCSESIRSNFTTMKPGVDGDNDICIIEEISNPPRPHPMTVTPRYLGQPLRTADPIPYTGAGEMRHKVNDERLIFRVALQDLSQPRTEADPPEGVLTVPLLRHQKIALSWMANKETAGMTCSGGILADDQGLGKTISTIALILKERSPSSKPAQQRSKLVTLNLDGDGDDDEIRELDESFAKDTYTQSKGRPSAGTLVVCPTSVLRQWADELRNKVTSEANLSVLVYHGSSRTKDPCELAKYDVVVTTYSIVSMEVPKQPLVDRDEDEENLEAKGLLPNEFSSSRKRKFTENSDKKPNKKALDKALLESAARPLAKVGWFRVVLDEAQSIKNHRTQVARACWGLRAKRRWCLSGTPIQNSIDDLYSYFRFLKYEPYAVYKSFCSSIKVPIQRNPAKGYKKLQAVLKTVMLRRTKSTILDGEPIINLPTKTIELRKVEFSKEERNFYLKLEADSRAQFAVYAAAGTVKQNYVNILLMLLRLRQACDHPCLVKKCAFSSVWRSSIEDAKKVPSEKRLSLVNCLEDGLALCGICNDVPDDVVVSVCGHVFCNQCISEHLTGDDNQCPMAACKVRLSTSSVFSKETLVTSMMDQPSEGNSPDDELVQTNEPTDSSFCSSKLKAAIEVLQSLPKYNIVSRCNTVMSSTKASSCQESPLNHSDGQEVKPYLNDQYVEGNDLNHAVKVVGEKAIVFSQWTRMLDLMETCLKNSSIEYRRLDGTMSVLARDKAVKDFNTIPEVTVMIMSLKAASLGLNMVAACHVLMLDLWWNPTTEDQAIDRAHRIGQTRPVKVLRLTVKDTVEDRILALQQKKREMVSYAFGEDEKGGRQSRLTVEDLRYLFMAH
ncbi:unnamed protein product [Rhodiola kirilowii]